MPVPFPKARNDCNSHVANLGWGVGNWCPNEKSFADECFLYAFSIGM